MWASRNPFLIPQTFRPGTKYLARVSDILYLSLLYSQLYNTHKDCGKMRGSPFNYILITTNKTLIILIKARLKYPKY